MLTITDHEYMTVIYYILLTVYNELIETSNSLSEDFFLLNGIKYMISSQGKFLIFNQNSLKETNTISSYSNSEAVASNITVGLVIMI